jgi:putative ABC transport system permease protein
LTFKLILENMRYRPLRSLLSALLIAIPVTLILTLVGMSQGMLAESARRTRGIGADIMVRPPNAAFMSFSGAPMTENLVPAMAKEPHVVVATGVIVAGIGGLESVTGVDLAQFNKMSGGFEYLHGGAFQRPDDILVDEYYARQHHLQLGDQIRVLGQNWRVAGIFASGKLARMVLPLATVQKLTANVGKVGMIYLKVDNAADVGSDIEVLQTKFEGYRFLSMAEYLSMVSIDNVPGLRPFIHVIIGIGVVIGFAVVCLSMYMAVLQRTREIGILKSLGASKGYVLLLVVAEAMAMGLAGTVAGILLSFVGRWVIMTLAPASLSEAIVPDWWPIAGAIALGASLLGALYPGFRAARQDPIEALAYE